MKFTEETAIEIIEKYDLAHTTIRVWRTRNKIPDKYADPDFQPRVKINKVENIKHNRLTEILKLKEISVSNFAKLVNISEHKLQEATQQPPTHLSASDLKKCEIELKKLRIEILKTFEKFSPIALKNLLKNPIFAYTKIIIEKQLTDKVYSIRVGKTEPEKEYWERLKDKYIMLSMRISI